MVQIKPECLSGLGSRHIFYIPYGSDKTNSGTTTTPPLYQFYIPYGSDKTFLKYFLILLVFSFISHMVQIKHTLKRAEETARFAFYIPYGSDKTQARLQNILLCTGFISHMVQIKRGNLVLRPSSHTSFISHMVQIKQIRSCLHLAVQTLLYPIWFR